MQHNLITDADLNVKSAVPAPICAHGYSMFGGIGLLAGHEHVSEAAPGPNESENPNESEQASVASVAFESKSTPSDSAEALWLSWQSQLLGPGL